MKKHKLLFLLLVILLSGCQGSGGGRSTPITIDTKLYKGTSGVELVLSNSFQNSLLEGQTFYYEAMARNKGPYPADSILVVGFEQGVITAQGGRSHYFSPFRLEGKTVYNQADDYNVIRFPTQVENLFFPDEKKITTIRTSLCYDYSGIAGTEVCIDKTTLESGEQAKCSRPVSNLAGGQGGPVAITNIETRMIPYGTSLIPQFKIYVQNLGSGKVIAPGARERVCRGIGIQPGDFNTVRLGSISFSRFSTGDFECYPLNLELKEQERNYFTCTLKGDRGISGIGGSFNTFLSVELLYGYMLTDNRVITIEPRS